MKVGFIALGKLGFASAVGAMQRGHEVWGYDADPQIRNLIETGQIQRYSFEPGIQEEFDKVADNFHMANSIQEVVDNCELIMLSPQTPHPPELDGSVRFKHARKDFDYSFLRSCCSEVATAIKLAYLHKVVVIVSTVLPGTTRTELLPIFQKVLGKDPGLSYTVLYSPSFIAQSTVVRDYKDPEFALLGVSEHGLAQGIALYESYLRTIHNAPILKMSWESAELAKVCYNTFLGYKIILANTVMEMCDGIPAVDCNEVMNALKHAHHRLISPAYMSPGMDDGGACHPRDNIAMAHISDMVGLPYNLFDYLMDVREKQTEYIAKRALDLNTSFEKPRPIVVMGRVFKPRVNQLTGSPSLLLENILKEQYDNVWSYDNIVGPEDLPTEPSIYIMTLRDLSYMRIPLVAGSAIIDPWGQVPQGHQDCIVYRIGRK